MTGTYDFSDVKGLEPIDEGEYVGQIVKAVLGESKQGEPKIDLHIKITEGEFENRVVFDTLAFHPNAMPFTKRKLEDLGLIGEDNLSGELVYLADALLGLDVQMIVVIQETDPSQVNRATGEPYPDRNTVKRYLGVLT